MLALQSFLSAVGVFLSVGAGENRATRKARGRPIIFIFSKLKSYRKILTSITAAEVGVRASSKYYHSSLFLIKWLEMVKITENLRWAKKYFIKIAESDN